MKYEELKELLQDYLTDKESGAYTLDCGHIVYPGHKFVTADIGGKTRCFCDEDCYGTFLTIYHGYDVETVPNEGRADYEHE